jgi:hypothetical protein
VVASKRLLPASPFRERQNKKKNPTFLRFSIYNVILRYLRYIPSFTMANEMYDGPLHLAPPEHAMRLAGAFDEASDQNDEDEDMERRNRRNRASLGAASQQRKEVISKRLTGFLGVFSKLAFDAETLNCFVTEIKSHPSKMKHGKRIDFHIGKTKSRLRAFVVELKSVVLLMDSFVKVHVNLVLEAINSKETFDSMLKTIIKGEPEDYWDTMLVRVHPFPKSKHAVFEKQLRLLELTYDAMTLSHVTNKGVRWFGWDEDDQQTLHELKRRGQLLEEVITMVRHVHQIEQPPQHECDDIDKDRYPWAAATSKFKDELLEGEKCEKKSNTNRQDREYNIEHDRAGFTFTKQEQASLHALIDGVENEFAQQEETESDEESLDPRDEEYQYVRTIVQQTEIESESDDNLELDEDDKLQNENKENKHDQAPKKSTNSNNEVLSERNINDPKIRKRYSIRRNGQFYHCVCCDHIRQVEVSMKDYVPTDGRLGDFGHFIDQTKDLDISARRMNSFKKMRRHMKAHFAGRYLSPKELETKLPPMFRDVKRKEKKRKRVLGDH